MSGKALGVVAIAITALSAAGLSGYLAGRTTPATLQTEQSASETPTAAAPAVAETEALVPQPASAPSPEPVERPAVAAPAPRPVEAAKPSPTPSKPERKPATERRQPARTGAEPQPAPAPPVVARNDTPKPAPSEQQVTRPAPPVEPVPEARPNLEPTPEAAPEPKAPRIEEFVVPADSVIGLQLDDTISSETARVEQRVEAHVSREVRVNGTVVIPANTRAQGQVTLVEPGGKFRDRARLGVRFHTLVLADGTSVPIQTDVIYREGEAVGSRSAARIGGSAAGGAILGAIFGGGKGAAIGAAAGAGAGTAATMATQKSQAKFNAGSTVTVRLTSPANVSVARED